MPDRVLLTGVSGFLGGHVAKALLAAGYQVRGSVRNLAKADKVRETLAKAGADVSRLEFVALDLLKDDGWDAAAEGCRFVAHTASPFVLQMPTDKMELIRPAIEGTERALNAGLKAGVERIVITSSMAAIAYGHDKNRTAPFTAADWTDLEGHGVSAYVESKTRAERRAWEIMKAAGREADLAVINPSGIFGPLLDEDPGTSAQIVIRFLEGRRAGRAAPQLRDHRRARRRRRPCRGVDRAGRRRTSLPDGRAEAVAAWNSPIFCAGASPPTPQAAALRTARLGGADLRIVRRRRAQQSRRTRRGARNWTRATPSRCSGAT